MTDAEAKSFTSRKLDLWNAISMDAELNPTERIVAWRLLTRASPTGEIFPSQETIGIEAALSQQTVKLSIGVLIKRGWIVRERKNRRRSNFYRFADGLVVTVRSEVDDCLVARTMRVRKRTFKKLLEGTKPTPVDGKFSDPVTVRKLPPNTYEGTPEVEHLQTLSMEEGGSFTEDEGDAESAPSANGGGARARDPIEPSDVLKSLLEKPARGESPHVEVKPPVVIAERSSVRAGYVPPDFDALEAKGSRR